MSLFGLLLSGLGLGYAVYKDNQKFANMNREATQLYGRGINEHFDGESLTNKYFRELKKYFDERYEHYISDKDYIMDHTNINEIYRPDITPEHLLQHYAGFLAYDDMFNKYAPDYVKLYNMNGSPYSAYAFAYIGRALARKEAYRLGFKPAHMANMNCKLGGQSLYFYNGCGECEYFPSEWESTKWDKEPYKYNYHTDYMPYGMPPCERK